MPNEARFGLLIGVALVVAVGVLFFQDQPVPAPQSQSEAPAAVQSSSQAPSSAAMLPPPVPPRTGRETKTILPVGRPDQFGTP